MQNLGIDLAKSIYSFIGDSVSIQENNRTLSLITYLFPFSVITARLVHSRYICCKFLISPNMLIHGLIQRVKPTTFKPCIVGSVTRKKSPSVYESFPKMISLEKL